MQLNIKSFFIMSRFSTTRINLHYRVTENEEWCGYYNYPLNDLLFPRWVIQNNNTSDIKTIKDIKINLRRNYIYDSDPLEVMHLLIIPEKFNFPEISSNIIYTNDTSQEELEQAYKNEMLGETTMSIPNSFIIHSEPLISNDGISYNSNIYIKTSIELRPKHLLILVISNTNLWGSIYLDQNDNQYKTYPVQHATEYNCFVQYKTKY